MENITSRELKKINSHQRDYRLDLLKILAIFFVVYYHFNMTGLYITDRDSFLGVVQNSILIICSTCIPLFFMVNGALLLNRPSLSIKKHIKKCVLIVLAYFAWRIITAISITSANGINLGIKDIIACMFVRISQVDFSHFWFIPTLISLYIIYPLFYLLINASQTKKDQYTHYMIFLIAFLLFIAIFTGDVNHLQQIFLGDVLYRIDFEAVSPFNSFKGGFVVYFLVGGLLYKYREQASKIKWFILPMCFAVGFAILFWYWRSSFEVWDIVYSSYNLLPTIIMSVTLFLLFLRVNNEKLAEHKLLARAITATGGNTLTIYYVHWIIGYIIWDNIADGTIAIPFNLGINLIKCIGLILICTIVGLLLRKIPILKHLAG